MHETEAQFILCVLALLFNCYSARHCSRVFQQMIIVLSAALQSAIRWPSKEEIRRNIPICFEDFTNIRVVLDCTKILIQNPKNLCCQIVTYSLRILYKFSKLFRSITRRVYHPSCYIYFCIRILLVSKFKKSFRYILLKWTFFQF